MQLSMRLVVSSFLLGLVLLAAVPLTAADKPDEKQLAQLIEQLGSNMFEEREQATKALEALGPAALDALRKAEKSGDPEVKSRAAALIRKAEEKLAQQKRRAEAEKLLAPTLVRLTFKETPVAEAVSDFSRKAGYPILLHDPEKKLAARTVTLDTGGVPFWEAFDRFCAAAGLIDATPDRLLPPGARPLPAAPKVAPAVPVPPPPPAPGGAVPALPVQLFAPGQVQIPIGNVPAGANVLGALVGAAQPGTFVLMDGKAEALPTAYSGAVRLRALKGAKEVDGAYQLHVEVRTEPKLHLISLEGATVSKAVDDQGQKLGQIKDVPPAAAAVAPGLPVPVMPLPAVPVVGAPGSQVVTIALKKGEQESQALQELAGTVAVRVMTPPEAIMSTENILKAKGETFKGKDGGSLKVLDVTQEEEKLTLRVEIEYPPAVMPGQGFRGVVPNFRPIPVRPLRPMPVPPPPQKGNARPAQVAPPLPVQPQVQVQVAQINIGAPLGNRGLTLYDDKGEVIAGQTRAIRGRNFNGQMTVEQTLEYTLKKGQQPARFAYVGSRLQTLDVPFTLKGVPLK